MYNRIDDEQVNVFHALADYIMTRALATHQTPIQVISELVEDKIAAAE
jgi:hypothetical protein